VCKWLCKGLHHPMRNCKHASQIKLVQKQLQLCFKKILQALTHATPNVAEKIFQFLSVIVPKQVHHYLFLCKLLQTSLQWCWKQVEIDKYIGIFINI